MTLLTQVRLARSLTIEEVAKGALVAQHELRWIERGGAPRLLDAVRLTQFFDCECHDLFPGTERHAKTFTGIFDGRIPLTRHWDLDMPEFDVDPRFWFFCVRLCGHWRRIHVRSQAVQKIRDALSVSRDCFLSVESCGDQIVLNCEYVSAFEIVARKESSWIKVDQLDDRDLSVLFAESPRERKFRFQNPEAIGDVLDSIEFSAPNADPFLEFDEPPRVCRRPFRLSHAAMAGSSMSA